MTPKGRQVPIDARGRLMLCRIFIRICIAYELWLSMVTVGGVRSGTSPMPDFDGDTVPLGRDDVRLRARLVGSCEFPQHILTEYTCDDQERYFTR
jgi:hypothetical protein